MNDGLIGFASRSSLLSAAVQSVVSGGGSSSSVTLGSSVPTQIQVTAADDFEARDLVFLDYRSGEVRNLNDFPSVNFDQTFTRQFPFVLGQGAGAGIMQSPDFPVTAGSGRAASNALRLADGSIIFASSIISMNGSPAYGQFALYKFSAKGVFLSKVIIEPFSQSTPGFGGIALSVLSNGNIAVVYLPDGISASAKWVIVTQTMQVVAKGQSAGAATTGYYHIQPTNNGGFVALAPDGLVYVSAAGVMTVLAAGMAIAPATQDDLNSNGITADVPASSKITNYQPIKISNGGFGYIYWTSSSGSGVFYVQVNADGSLRAAPVLLAAFSGTPSQWFKMSRLAGGNIAYVLTGTTSASVYGVVSDAGAVVRAAAANSNAETGGSSAIVSMVADAGGGAVIVTFSGGNWYMKCLTSAGAEIAGSSRLLGAGSALIPKLLRLSTGTIIVYSKTQTDYVYNYALIALDGSLSINTTLYKFNYGYSGQSCGVMVVDDKVYGCMGAAAGPDFVSFSISNTGAVVVQQHSTGIATVSGAGQDIRVVLDSTGRYMIAACTFSGVSCTLTVELSALFLHSVNASLPSLDATRLRVIGGALVAVDAARAFGYSSASPYNPGSLAYCIKPFATMLLGVADGAAVKGGRLVVNTKGLFGLSPAWAKLYWTYDASAVVSVPGNSFNLNNCMIALKGFA